jgi:hypothetical protein
MENRTNQVDEYLPPKVLRDTGRKTFKRDQTWAVFTPGDKRGAVILIHEVMPDGSATFRILAGGDDYLVTGADIGSIDPRSAVSRHAILLKEDEGAALPVPSELWQRAFEFGDGVMCSACQKNLRVMGRDNFGCAYCWACREQSGKPTPPHELDGWQPGQWRTAVWPGGETSAPFKLLEEIDNGMWKVLRSDRPGKHMINPRWYSELVTAPTCTYSHLGSHCTAGELFHIGGHAGGEGIEGWIILERAAIEDGMTGQIVAPDVWRAGQRRRFPARGNRYDKEDGGQLLLLEGQVAPTQWMASDLRGEHWVIDSNEASKLFADPKASTSAAPFEVGQFRRGLDNQTLAFLFLILEREGAYWKVRDLRGQVRLVEESTTFEVIDPETLYLPVERGRETASNEATGYRLTRFKFNVITGDPTMPKIHGHLSEQEIFNLQRLDDSHRVAPNLFPHVLDVPHRDAHQHALHFGSWATRVAIPPWRRYPQVTEFDLLPDAP